MMRFQRSTDVAFVEHEDESTLMDLRSGLYFGLDEVGTRLWGLMEHPVPLAQLVDTLGLEFEVSAEQCRSEVSELLSVMVERGLVYERAE